MLSNTKSDNRWERTTGIHLFREILLFFLFIFLRQAQQLERRFRKWCEALRMIRIQNVERMLTLLSSEIDLFMIITRRNVRLTSRFLGRSCSKNSSNDTSNMRFVFLLNLTSFDFNRRLMRFALSTRSRLPFLLSCYPRAQCYLFAFFF